MNKLTIPERNNLTKTEYIEVLTRFIFNIFYGDDSYDISKACSGYPYCYSKRLAVSFCNKIYTKRGIKNDRD